MHYLIVHGLIKINGKYLVIKRTEFKRGKPNTFPLYWDIPGGMVEDNELPKDAVIRETKEEVNLDIEVGDIIHEDSNYDEIKKNVYTRLVYECFIKENQSEKNIILQKDEHSDYKLISNLNEMVNEKVVVYLEKLIK